MYPSWTPRRRGLGWTVYAWLVYLVFFFAYAAVEKSVQVWVLSLLAVAAFLPLYLRGFQEEGRRLLAIAWAIFIIGGADLPHQPGGKLLLHLRDRVCRLYRPSASGSNQLWR